MIKAYSDAIEHLNSLRAAYECHETDSTPEDGQAREPADCKSYLWGLGYSPEDLNKLNVIHITGTKGRSLTGVFTESIIRQMRPAWKTGLYTSSHLLTVREQIQINGRPLSENLFAKYFFDVWDRLSASNVHSAMDQTDQKEMPGYLQFLNLLAFYTFIQEGVNAAITEVAVGGAYDPTGVVSRPIITGITSTGLDHIPLLDHAIRDIVGHGTGTFKERTPVITVNQSDDALNAIFDRTEALKTSDIMIATSLPELSIIQLGERQRESATLAVHLAKAFFSAIDPYFKLAYSAPSLPPPFIRGLEKAKRPGRCQMIHDVTRPGLSWFLDVVHTVEGLEPSLNWYLTAASGSPSIGSDRSGPKEPTRILVFCCTYDRLEEGLSNTICACYSKIIFQCENGTPAGKFFHHIIFCPHTTHTNGYIKGELTEHCCHRSTGEFANFESLVEKFPREKIHFLPSIEDGVRLIDSIKEQGSQPAFEVLVIGSLCLVGGIIEAAGIIDQVMR